MFQSLTQEGQPIDIRLLNKAVVDFYTSPLNEADRTNLNKILVQFSQRKDIYLFIQQVISSDCDMLTKNMTINSFKNFVNTSWEFVPENNRQELRHYIWSLLFVEKIPDQIFVTKAIEIIVSVSKYEYPSSWPDFIQQLLSASSESLENALAALKCIEIFSQEISDFAENSLTSARAAEMLNSFTQELQSVINFIQKSISSDAGTDIIKQALETFCALVKWIDPSFFFQTNILNQLCTTFLEDKNYSSIIIRILGEIVSVNWIPEDYYPNLGPIFSAIISKLQVIHDDPEGNFFYNPSIISLLANTLTSFLTQYYEAVEKPEYSNPLILFHQWLIELTAKDSEDDMDFQENDLTQYNDSLITYWYELAQRIYSLFYEQQSEVRAFYEPFLPSIRRALISKIPPPYGFTEVEEEDGFRSHRVVFNTKFGDLYSSAKDALVLLTNLDLNDSVRALEESMTKTQSSGFNRLDLVNKTAWAFGAIVSALSEQSNKLFVTNFIGFYISLFNEAGNMQLDEQALFQAKHAVAMACCFICSQAHKFLLRDDVLFTNIVNWMLSLLQYPDDEVKAVSIKSLELLCTTNCDQMISKQKVAPAAGGIQQAQGGMSILEQILSNFEAYYSSLSESSLYSFFSLTSALIRNVSSEQMKEQMFKIAVHFLDSPLQQILPLEPKIDPPTWHGLTLLVQCNTALATSLGNFYVSFFLSKFDLLMGAFTTLTGFLIQYQSQQGTDMNIIRAARTASDAIISLLERTINYCYDLSIVREKLWPICMTSILQSFSNTPPIAKSPKVLKLFGTLALKCQSEFVQNYRVVFDNIYIPVYQMIQNDFVSYEYIRLDFFEFMLSLVRACIDLILSLPPEEFNMFIEAIKFGMNHPKNEISEKSHMLLTEFIDQIKLKLKDKPDQLSSFTNTYAIPLLMFAFQILTDTSHKSSFTYQVSLIKSLLTLPSISELGAPLCDNLCQLFNDQPPQLIEKLLIDLTNTMLLSNLDFNNVLKDFLISVKHLLRQDPDLLAAQKKEALEKTQQLFKSIGQAHTSPLGDFPDSL